MKRSAVTAIATLLVVLFGYLVLREPSPPSELLGSVPLVLAPADAEGAGVSLVVQAENPGIEELGARWYFNWHFVPHEGVDLPYVPLVCGYPGDRQVSEAHLSEVGENIRSNPQDYPDGTLFLIGNEIGYTHQKDGRSPREYAEDFHRCSTLLNSINPTFQMSVGPAILSTDEDITNAIVNASDGLDYLSQVISEYQELYDEPIPTEYFAATHHVTAATKAELDVFQQRLIDMRTLLADVGLRDRNVILTEFGVPTRGSAAHQIEWFLEESTRVVATTADAAIGHPRDNKLVQRYAWFTARPLSSFDKLRSLGFGAFFLQLAQTSLHNHEGESTHLGRSYSTMISQRTGTSTELEGQGKASGEVDPTDPRGS